MHQHKHKESKPIRSIRKIQEYMSYYYHRSNHKTKYSRQDKTQHIIIRSIPYKPIQYYTRKMREYKNRIHIYYTYKITTYNLVFKIYHRNIILKEMK